MSKIAVDKFIALVERSGLIPPERLKTLIEEWKRGATAQQLDNAEHCGAFLVHQKALTRWQCHKLLDGRHRGFMLGNYKLLDHLGSGGMSNVYLAEHVLMQRRVAIKVLPEHRVGDAGYLARFHFEGQAVAALDHPNIVRAYDLGSEGKIHYFVMEYVEGSDLQELVEKSGPLSYALAAYYIAQAATGLEHAHSSGLIHRDVKPANLLVDLHGTVKVLDLGLAKFRAEVRPIPEFALDEQVLGTAAYFAPEQAINSQTVDARADIYGLGCTFYYLLTGHAPFDGETPIELMTAHHRQQAPSILDDRPDAPPALLEICHKMMEKSADARFQSAKQVADALNRWLSAERTAGRVVGDARDSAKESAAPFSSDLGDTQVNLQETAKIQRDRPASHVFAPLDVPHSPERESGTSDVITPPAAPTPPVVPPPRSSEIAPVQAVVPTSQPVLAPQSAAREEAFEPAPIAARFDVSRSVRHGAQQRVFWWSLALAAVVFAALCWATVMLVR